MSNQKRDTDETKKKGLVVEKPNDKPKEKPKEEKK